MPDLPVNQQYFSVRRNSFLLFLVLVFAITCLSQTASNPQTLVPGKSVELAIAGAEQPIFNIELTGGQYANIVLEQRGIDVIVQLVGQDGKPSIDFDSELRANGEERIEFVALLTGEHRLLIKSKYPLLPAGHVAIRLEDVRPATEDERVLDEARRLRTKAWQLRMADKYTEAFPIAEKALQLQESVLGTEHGDLVFTLFVLAVISEFKIDYPSAEAFYLRGHAVAEKTLGRDHLLLGRGYSAAAYFYFRHRGDYARAEELFKRGLTIREAALGPDHPEVAKSVKDLGFLSVDVGDYAKAEEYLRRAVQIGEKTFGPEHVEVAMSLMYLAGAFSDKGDYEQAEALFSRSLGYLEKSFGAESGWAAIGMKNLAGLYLTMGEYGKSEALFLRAMNIDLKGNAPDHPDILRVRHELSDLYLKTGEIDKFEKISKDLLSSLQKRFGSGHRYVALHLYLLAKASIRRNDLSRAEADLRKAIPIFEAAVGPRYHVLAEVLLDLSYISASRGKVEEALELQQRAGSILEYNLNINLATGSERQKLAYLGVLPDHMDRAIALHKLSNGREPKTIENVATSILRRKGRVQDALSNSVSSLRERSGADDKALLDRLTITTSRLARLVLDGPGSVSLSEHQERIKKVEVEREEIENEISRRSPVALRQTGGMDLANIRSAISVNEALVEFVVYNELDASDPAKRGEKRYLAYVLRGSGDLHVRDLGQASEIDVAVTKFRQAIRDPRRKDVDQLARNLEARIIRPLLEFVGNARHLLISPDGELSLIPFEALIDASGRYLVENYSVTYLTTGRDLARPRSERKVNSLTAIVADPIFGEKEPDSPPTAKLTRSSTGRRSLTNTRNLSDTYFAPLGGAALEAAAIKSLFPEASMLTKAAATETAVKSLAAPNMLHIATHGYFLDPGDAKVSTDRDNPLLRSGLAFVGANLRIGEKDDGILTALEASGLDLWGTKLVVLSACDTGVGEIRTGEGVYGLRRSFVLAGAESLVMSLWPVSDMVTRELMTNYYKNLKAGMGRGEALRQVKLAMIKRPTRKHPFYWASFIHSGEWANLEGKR
jgi:CHAT domain-containing protein